MPLSEEIAKCTGPVVNYVSYGVQFPVGWHKYAGPMYLKSHTEKFAEFGITDIRMNNNGQVAYNRYHFFSEESYIRFLLTFS